jgi:hypothetical protein
MFVQPNKINAPHMHSYSYAVKYKQLEDEDVLRGEVPSERFDNATEMRPD